MTNTRRPLVAGNWKMHGRRASAQALASALASADAAELDVVVCPPYLHLQVVAEQLAASGVQLGAQNLATQTDDGALTGEVSGAMLRDADCAWVIVGHSERRALLGEDDARVATKFTAAQAAGLVPILCVGETLEEREAGKGLEVVGRQLRAVMAEAGVTAFANAVVAYEPVWAIGTGRTAAPADAQEVHAHLRCLVADENAKIAGSLRILYGGSVKPNNAAELFSQPDIDGGLIGGAALEAASFLSIVDAARHTTTP